jgi:hypothetical protein
MKPQERLNDIERAIETLADMVQALGLLPSDESHCLKVLSDLQHDIESMSGLYD